MPGFGRGTFRLGLQMQQSQGQDVWGTDEPSPPSRAGSGPSGDGARPGVGRGRGRATPTTPPVPSPQPKSPLYYPSQPVLQPMPSMETDYTEPENCLYCQRPPSNVVCRSCAHTFIGRVSSSCKDHPGLLHLMDIRQCPECLNSQIMETSTPQRKISPSPLRETVSPSQMQEIWD